MGRRIGIGILVLVIIIVAAAAIAPYFVGGAAETNFKARVAEVNLKLADEGLNLHVDSYHRGFYGSGANISLVATQEKMNENMKESWEELFGTDSTPVFHLHISHGPIPFDAFGYGHWNFMPVLYTAGFHGKSLPADSVVGMLKPDVYVVQYFTGSTRSRLTVPPGEKCEDGSSAKWQGGHVAVEMNAARDQMDYTGVLEPIAFQSAASESEGAYSGTFAGLHFSGSSRKAQHDFWVGPAEYSFGKLTVSKDGTEIVNLEPGHAQGDTTETGDGQWLNSTAQGKQDGGVIRGWKYSSFTSGYQVSKLDAAGLRQALDALDEQAAGEFDSMQMLGHMLPLLAQAVKPETTASLDLALAAPSGTVSVAADLSFPVSTSSAASAGDAGSNAMANARLEVNLNFDLALVEDFYSVVLGAPTATLNRNVQSLTQAGYLQQTGGHYHATIVYQHGMTTINGKPFQMARPAGTAPSPASANSPQTAPVPAS